MAQGTSTTAEITWRLGLNRYSVFAIMPSGEAVEYPSVWSSR